MNPNAARGAAPPSSGVSALSMDPNAKEKKTHTKKIFSFSNTLFNRDVVRKYILLDLFHLLMVSHLIFIMMKLKDVFVVD